MAPINGEDQISEHKKALENILLLLKILLKCPYRE